jgi:hypothetical protein
LVGRLSVRSISCRSVVFAQPLISVDTAKVRLNQVTVVATVGGS